MYGSDAIEIKARAVEERGLVADTLCAKCRHGHVYRRRNQLHVEVYCTTIGQRVAPDIVECSAFMSVKDMELWEIREIGKEIDPREGVNNGSYA